MLGELDGKVRDAAGKLDAHPPRSVPDNIPQNVDETEQHPSGGGLVRTPLDEDRQDREGRNDPQKYGAQDRDRDRDEVVQSPEQDDDPGQEKDHGEFQQKRDRPDDRLDVPRLPILEAYLAHEDVLAGCGERRVPLEILAHPLFGHDAE